ncbi:MAG: hypothetical protein MPJ78_11400 [Hyphomicrobiaceae bacterium]|nr:hypothetical protein [Hyphomicrobiaceae bacterium]
MSKDFHEAYVEQDVPPPSERATGIVFAVVAAIIGLIFRDNSVVLGVCAVLCVGFAGVSWIAPALLKPLNLVWFRFSLLLHKIVNPIILGIMFLVAIVPFGLMMRIWRDPLRRKRTAGKSYWIERGEESPETHSMTNQF